MASNADRVQKVLDFLNGVQAPEEIVKRIEDDPEHGSPSEEAVGVPLWVAQEILDARSELPNQRFESLAQVEAVRGLGEDTLHDIFRTVNDSPEPTPPSSEPIPPSSGPDGPTGGIPEALRIWLPRVAMLALGVYGGWLIPRDEPGLLGSLVLDPSVYATLDTLLAGHRQDTLVLDPSVFTLSVDRPNPESALVELDSSFYTAMEALVANSDALVANNAAALSVLVGELQRRTPETTSAAGPVAFEHDITFTEDPNTGEVTGAECTMDGALVIREVTPGAPSQ